MIRISRSPIITPSGAAIVLATTAALALAACGGTDDAADAPAASTPSADTGNGSGGNTGSADSMVSTAGSGGADGTTAGSGSETADHGTSGTPGSSGSSASPASSAATVTASASGPVSVPASEPAPSVSATEPAPSSPMSGTPSSGPAASGSSSVPPTQTLVGDTSPIEPIPCEGANYLGEITPMPVDEAASKIDQLRDAHPDAKFGHFTEPCGPEDQLVIYWGEASDSTAPLLQQRRELEAPRVVVLQLDPQRPGYLDTGLCDLQAAGEPPTLKAGDDLDRTDKNWLFELTSYLGRNGLIHPDQAGITEIDEMVDTGIRSYQERNGLAVDGVVGADTWEALSGELCSGGAPELKPIER